MTRGELFAEGKTKRVWEVQGRHELAILESKDDITAGDGKKHDIIPGKARWATTTTCNVFSLLAACGVPVAFREQLDETSFLADYTEMIPLEVVMRREAHGSFLKRRPDLLKGTVFPRHLFELYLKTSGKKWQGQDIPCDDPLILQSGERLELYIPSVPLETQEPFLIIHTYDVPGFYQIGMIEEITRKTFSMLIAAWQIQGIRLVDLIASRAINLWSVFSLDELLELYRREKKVSEELFAEIQAYRGR